MRLAWLVGVLVLAVGLAAPALADEGDAGTQPLEGEGDNAVPAPADGAAAAQPYKGWICATPKAGNGAAAPAAAPAPAAPRYDPCNPCWPCNPCTPCEPVWETVEVPCYAQRCVPVHQTIQIAVFETRQVPCYQNVCDPCTGVVRQVQCGTRCERVQTGTRTEQVLCGYRTECYQNGTRKVQRFLGYRPCGAAAPTAATPCGDCNPGRWVTVLPNGADKGAAALLDGTTEKLWEDEFQEQKKASCATPCGPCGAPPAETTAAR